MPLPQTELNELANLGDLLKSTLVALIDEFPISVRSIGYEYAFRLQSFQLSTIA